MKFGGSVGIWTRANCSDFEIDPEKISYHWAIGRKAVYGMTSLLVIGII